MEYRIRINTLVFLTITVFFLLCFAGTLHAVNMPVFERYQPITDTINAPTAVALDVSDNIYVTESSNNQLLVYSPTGRYLKLISGLDKPLGVAVSSDGMVFITNAGWGNVEVYDSDSALLYKLGSGDGEFTYPVAIAVDGAGAAYVADSEEDMIKVYNPDGSFKFSFGTTGSGDGQFNFPTSISINEPLDEIVVSDLQIQQSETGPYRGARIQFFEMNGSFKRSFGTYGVGEGNLVRPLGVAVDDDGRVYVADAYQNVVQVFDNDGVFLGTISDPDNSLRTPLGMAFSKKSFRLFVASLNTFKVEVYGIDSHTITVSSSVGGVISPSEIVFVKHGEDQSFTITPDVYHQLVDVKVDGSSVGEVTEYTFNDVTIPHAIEAEFMTKNLEPTIELVEGDKTTELEQTTEYIPNNVSAFQTDKAPIDRPIMNYEGETFMGKYSSILKYLFIVGFLIVISAVAMVKRRSILDRLNQGSNKD